jgi:hypothetical protein
MPRESPAGAGGGEDKTMARSTTAATTVLLALAITGAMAQAQAPTAAMPASAPPPDALPHQLHPDDWPQPDYFSIALAQTHFRPAPRFAALKLLGARDPAVLVLPVQMQAFGWTPAFAAMMGARLDHELAARGIDANRQTELFDADGPYARRFDDAAIPAFAAAHPKSPQALALYIGRDGEGHDFVTLTLRSSGSLRRAHRTVAEAADADAAYEAMAATLPALLTELGLAPRRAPSPPETPRRCTMDDWALPDPTPATPRSVRACHALLLGTLLPELEPLDRKTPNARTPDKTAWLAEAALELDALPADVAAAAAQVLHAQFDLRSLKRPPIDAIKLDDPVIGRLAQLLSARMQVGQQPQQSLEAAREKVVESAAQGLPPFVRAAFIERGAYDVRFRNVDLCAIALALPGIRRPAGCGDRKPVDGDRTRPATRGETALLNAWELAWATKGLYVEGYERGDPEARAAVLAALPERVATHPVVRRERFFTEHFDDATGSYESLVARARPALTDAVQTTADLQRWESQSLRLSISTGHWTEQQVLLHDPSLASLIDDDVRLKVVLQADGARLYDKPFDTSAEARRLHALSPGPTGGAVAAAAPAGAASTPFFVRPPGWDVAKVERTAKERPRDVQAQLNLAIVRLRGGADIATARDLIDTAQMDTRTDPAVTLPQSRAWSWPAGTFWEAGDLDAAKVYLQRVISFNTGTDSDLLAHTRLFLLAGDRDGALRAAQESIERYRDDLSRRDASGLYLLQGRPDRAWDVLAPRLPMSDQIVLWEAALAARRFEHRDARETIDWLEKNSYGHSRGEEFDAGTALVLHMVTDDRAPEAADVALVDESLRRRGFPQGSAILRATALLQRLAFEPHVGPEELRELDELVAASSPPHASLKPLYAWVAKSSGSPREDALALLRDVPVDSDLDSLLAGAVVAGLEQHPDQALRYLRAARITLGSAVGQYREHWLRSPHYTWALVAWLLYDRTHDARYRDEALFLVHARERTSPWLAWTWALDALLSPEGPARQAAACRAAFLDPGSRFLALSGLRPDAHGERCRKALW